MWWVYDRYAAIALRDCRGTQEPARLGHLRRIAEPAPPAHDGEDERHGTPDQGKIVRQRRAAHVHEVERQPQRQQALDIGALGIGAPDRNTRGSCSAVMTLRNVP